MTCAILLAAGKSLRFGYSKSKLLYKWKNKPLFKYSLDVLIQNKKIDYVLIVIPNDQTFKDEIKKIKSPKILSCFGDDKFRWKSLENGMSFLSKKFQLKSNDIILTHDAARVKISQDVIDHHLLITKKYGYASTVLPIYDSLCEINKKSLYLNRQHKYLVQTPQTFQYKYWKQTNNKNATDLFTYLNLQVASKNLIIGNHNNFKITTQKDLNDL